MKTFIKLIALGALAGIVLTGISVHAAESSEELTAKHDYSLITNVGKSESLEIMEALSFESSDGTVLPYRKYYSPAYNAEDKANPAMVFVFLHGSGGQGDNNEQQLRDQISTVNYLISPSAEEVLADVPYIVIAPQCHKENQWVNTPYNQNSYNIDEVPLSPPLNAVYELILKVLEEDNADKDNVMLGGMSMGGYGTWDLATRYPELFNAIFPICGSGDPSHAENLKDIKIWTFHSDNDVSVPVKGTREMVEALEKIGADVHYTEFQGKGHNAWTPAMEEVKDPYLLEWLIEDCRLYTVNVLTKEGEELTETTEKLRIGDKFSIEMEPTEGFVPEKLYINGVESEFVTDDNGSLYIECTVTGNMEITAEFVEEKAEEESSVAEGGKGGLSGGAKIGIIAGAAAVLGGIIGIIAAKKKKKK